MHVSLSHLSLRSPVVDLQLSFLSSHVFLSSPKCLYTSSFRELDRWHLCLSPLREGDAICSDLHCEIVTRPHATLYANQWMKLCKALVCQLNSTPLCSLYFIPLSHSIFLFFCPFCNARLLYPPPLYFIELSSCNPHFLYFLLLKYSFCTNNGWTPDVISSSVHSVPLFIAHKKKCRAWWDRCWRKPVYAWSICPGYG